MRWVNLLSPQKWSDTDKKNCLKQTDYYDDYMHICISHMIRHMQEKSHVFPLNKESNFSTGYTHSVETSAIAKLIGSNIVNITIKTGKKTALNEVAKSQICELLSCASMLHGVGKPPFGKFGEGAIRLWFKSNLNRIYYKEKPLADVMSDQMCGDFYCFSSASRNLHCIFRYSRSDVNLTSSMLSTLIIPCESDKYKGLSQSGYLFSERKEVQKLYESVELLGNRHPLSYVIEAADRISSITSVIENSVTSGMITCQQLMNELRREDYFEEDIAQEEYQRFASIVKYLGVCYNSSKTRFTTNFETIAMQKWISYVQDELAEFAAQSFVNNYEDIMKGVYLSNIFDDSWCRIMRNALKDVEKKYIFNSEIIISFKNGVDRIINFMLDIFVNAVIYYDTDTELCSRDRGLVTMIGEKYKRVYRRCSRDKDEIEKLYLRLVMVIDYICDMSDKNLKNIYKKLNGIF